MLADLINPEKARRAVLYTIVMLLAHMAQHLVLSHVAVMGVRPMFLPIFSVTVGMFEGGLWGGVFGLVSGLLLDMAFVETTVLFTVLFPLFGFFTGMLANFSVNKRFFSYACIALAALVITAAAQATGPILMAGADTREVLFVAGLQVLLSIPLLPTVYFPVKTIASKLEET